MNRLGADPSWGATADEERTRSVAVVGGGVTGLAAAHRLREVDPRLRVVVCEAGARPGGVLQTVREGGCLIEASADSFLTAIPWALDLCRRLGLEDQLLPTDPAYRQAFVVREGRLERIPDGLAMMAPGRLLPLLTTPILSLRSKLRLAAELFVRPGSGEDESLASFAVRRFGREAYERLIQPLVGGMYTGDPERLSVKATMPRFLDMERTHGSLIRAARSGRAAAGGDARAGRGARYGLFVTPRGGMSDLIDALVRRLPPDALHCRERVVALARVPDGGWTLSLGGGASFAADAVILATPARDAGRLLAGVDPVLSARLGRITSASCAIASLVYRREQIGHPLDGFGFVVPMVEDLPILSGSFSSVKFPGRSPAGLEVVRVFLGGARSPEVLDLDDGEAVELAARELGKLLQIRGEPVSRHLTRWPQVMPQYQVGHVELVERIEARVGDLPGLELAGNAYHGVGVPHCIRSGERAAERVASDLGAGAGLHRARSES